MYDQNGEDVQIKYGVRLRMDRSPHPREKSTVFWKILLIMVLIVGVWFAYDYYNKNIVTNG